MNNKTDIITNKPKTLGHLENWFGQQMPQLQQLNKSNTKQEGLQQNQPQFEFINLKIAANGKSSLFYCFC